MVLRARRGPKRLICSDARQANASMTTFSPEHLAELSLVAEGADILLANAQPDSYRGNGQEGFCYLCFGQKRTHPPRPQPRIRADVRPRVRLAVPFNLWLLGWRLLRSWFSEPLALVYELVERELRSPVATESAFKRPQRYLAFEFGHIATAPAKPETAA